MYRCFYFSINNDDFDCASIHSHPFNNIEKKQQPNNNVFCFVSGNKYKEDEKHKPIGFIAEWMNAYKFVSRKLNNNHRKV